MLVDDREVLFNSRACKNTLTSKKLPFLFGNFKNSMTTLASLEGLAVVDAGLLQHDNNSETRGPFAEDE